MLDVVRKEFKEHVGEMKSLQTAGREKNDSSNKWATFDDDDHENCHPNLFAPPQQAHSVPMKQANFSPVNADCNAYRSRHY